MGISNIGTRTISLVLLCFGHFFSLLPLFQLVGVNRGCKRDRCYARLNSCSVWSIGLDMFLNVLVMEARQLDCDLTCNVVLASVMCQLLALAHLYAIHVDDCFSSFSFSTLLNLYLILFIFSVCLIYSLIGFRVND